MRVITGPNAKPVKMWVDFKDGEVPVEQPALEQLKNVASLPFIFKHVAVMPDVHLGKGATVGSVIPTVGAVIPAAVGVDIGCGMIAQRLDLFADELPTSLAAWRQAIEDAVPVGNGAGGERNRHCKRADEAYSHLYEDYVNFVQPFVKDGKGAAQVGTLGGGNHFIELCLDENDRVWLMLHSGSRNIGNKIGTYFIEKAKEDMRRHFVNLPDKELAYIPEGTDHFYHYTHAVAWAQRYASANRLVMLREALNAIDRERMKALPMDRTFLPCVTTQSPIVQCHHNYIARENHFGQNVWVTRKGAVSAREGQLGIIPGAMGQRSYIVEGKGHAESFTSCSHGAGRAMSRTEAKRRFTLEDHAKATEGVECRKDEGVLDETPAAYKNLDHVMEAQADLVSIKHTLRAVLTVKG